MLKGITQARYLKRYYITIVMQAFISVLIIYTIWYEYNINKYFNIPILIIFLIFNILTLKKLMYEQKNYN